ncbi:phage tail protein, partial [Sinorhizobium medicae]|nr:phage tail protein [Sinorhizobium medicae]
MAIFTGIATAIAGALFGGSALATSLIGGALAFGAKFAIGKIQAAKQGKQKYTAVQGEIQFGGDVPVGTLYGVGKTKGQRAFYAKWDKGNKRNAEVFILANGWCDGLEPYVYMYGEKYNLVAQAAIGNEVARYGVQGFIDGDGNSAISIRFYDGRPGQGVDQRLVDVTANLGNKWKATSKLSGMCYVVVERYYHLEFFRDAGKGKPDIDFALRGLREYDPRKDSTVAGGSGTQRLNTPSTWVHTKNPAVHRLNYQLGLRALVSGRTLIGEGKSLGQIDLATYFVAMNVCDTLRANGKKTYECSLFVSGDDDHTEVLKQFDDAMAGYGLNRRGLSGVIPGAPQIPVKDLTAADIPIDRAKDVQFRPSAFERFNHLSGQFTSIESMWNPESLKPVYVNADIAADGRNRQTSIDFLQVTDPDIAQYLLNIRYRQNRMGGKATVPVSRRFGLAVQEGEWITWRGKSWLISEWRADERLRITLVLSETSAAIYDDDGIEPGPIVVPPTPPINP